MNKPERCRKLYEYDCSLWAEGLVFAGIDEAGRGPLAGCVTAACVVMPSAPAVLYVDDSKKVPEAMRYKLFDEIAKHALYIGVGRASVEEIEEINILQATRLAMRRAARGAPVSLFLVDAVGGLGLEAERPIIHGDEISYSIAAASIIAKVTRDREMQQLDRAYPGYGFFHNKGYGTAEHMAAIRSLGLCPLHRKAFVTRIELP